MEISERKIREVREHISISYEKAERYLRHNDGNVEKTIIYAEVKEERLIKRCIRSCQKLCGAFIDYRIKITHGNSVLVDLPVYLFVIMAFFIQVNRFFIIMFVYLMIIMVTDCKIEFHRVEKERSKKNLKTIPKEKNPIPTTKTYPERHSVRKSSSPIKEGLVIEEEKHKDQDIEQEAEEKEIDIEIDEEDGYYEVTIDK